MSNSCEIYYEKIQISYWWKLYEEKYDFSKLTFPIPLNEIKLFEKNDPGVYVNVYGMQKENLKNILRMKCIR